MQQGLDEKNARKRASSEVKAYLGTDKVSAVRSVSAPSGQTGHRTNGQNGQLKSRVRSHLDAHPEMDGISINQVLAELQDAGVQVGRTTVAEVLQERRGGE
jgi:hypothetical protein